MSSTFLLSELSLKTRRQTQGQDLMLNVANSGMGPSQSFMECPYCHQSVVTLEEYFCSAQKQFKDS